MKVFFSCQYNWLGQLIRNISTKVVQIDVGSCAWRPKRSNLFSLAIPVKNYNFGSISKENNFQVRKIFMLICFEFFFL